MFRKIFKKKSTNELKLLIEAEGIENVALHIAEIINEKILSQKIAYQFILEELDAASKGNTMSQKFCNDSSIKANEYSGAIMNSVDSVDGVNGPQQLLHVICMQLMSDPHLMTRFRIIVVDNIMNMWYIGKYA